MPDSDKPNDLNLDLIQMVQKARMMHDETARPSDIPAVYWIEAKGPAGDYPPPTSNAGEWRIPLTAETVDAVWEQVKRATAAGKLGYKSKVSTRPAAGQSHPEERLLCVRSYHAGDQADVERIKQALLDMGLRDLSYARDKDS